MSYIKKQPSDECLPPFLARSITHHSRLDEEKSNLGMKKFSQPDLALRRKSLTRSPSNKKQKTRMVKNASNLDRKINSGQTENQFTKNEEEQTNFLKPVHSTEKKVEKLPSINRFKSLSLNVNCSAPSLNSKHKPKGINKSIIFKGVPRQQSLKVIDIGKDLCEAEKEYQIQQEQVITEGNQQEGGKKYFYIRNLTLQNEDNPQPQKNSNLVNKIMNKFRQIDRRNKITAQSVQKKLTLSPDELIAKKLRCDRKKSTFEEEKQRRRVIFLEKIASEMQLVKQQNFVKGWEAEEDGEHHMGWMY